LDLLTPRFAVEAHLANVFAEEAVPLTEQQMAQEQATASEPGEKANSGMALGVFVMPSLYVHIDI